MTRKTFGTFAGVFTPTTLTILGVILYIRQPWVVGNAGIVGTLLIDKNWKGTIDVNLIEDHFKPDDIIIFKEMIRFPQKTNDYINPGKLIDRVPLDRKADLNIISIPPDLSVEDMIEIVNSSRVSALFCYDSGYENVFV